MNGRFGFRLAVALATAAFLTTATAGQDQADPPTLTLASPVHTLNGFVENRGQWDETILYVARRGHEELTLTRDALALRRLPAIDSDETPPPHTILRLPRSAPSVKGRDGLATAHHFILGNGTTSHVPGFAEVIYRDIEPGIDLVVRSGPQGFAYDLHVASGVDLAGLAMTIEGVAAVEHPRDQVLSMETASGLLEQHIGDSWEIDADGGRHLVLPRFEILDVADSGARFGFSVPERDASRPLVIDPSLVWGTYVGDFGQELVHDLEVGPDGSVYLAIRAVGGSTPTTPNANQPANPGGANAWVGKLSADGSTLEWATFLGGSATENILGLELDTDGTVVVVGDTWSPEFPTTPGTVQPLFGGANDMFISRLAVDGSVLVWSTFYGGAENDHADALVILPSGDIVIAGDTETPEPPATPGAYDTEFVDGKMLFARLTADGTEVVFQTYFPLAGVSDMTVAASGDICFVSSASSVVPTTPGAYKTSPPSGGPGDAYVAALHPLGTHLQWATFLGGDEDGEIAYGIAIDAAGAVYVAGVTDSDDFPVTPGAFETSPQNPDDNFVAKLLPGGTDLVWATYLSACCGGVTILWDIVVDSAGRPTVVGSSNEPNFPTTPNGLQPTYIGPFPASDAHLTRLNAFGETLEYSTYYGGNGGDVVNAFVGLDPAEDPVFAINSTSTNIPVTPGAYDTSYAGGTDVVVAKFDLDPSAWQVLAGGLSGAVHTPNLAGSGALTPGAPGRLSLRGAAPSSTAFIVAGASAIHHPLEGGTLVPEPTLVVPLTTNAAGALDLPFLWLDVPTGIDVWVQVWLVDPGGPFGYAASNALQMTSQ